MPDASMLILCRPGFESVLTAECADLSVPASPLRPGLVQVDGDLPSRPLVFEDVRLTGAAWVPQDELKPIRPDLVRRIFRSGPPEPVPYALALHTEEAEAERLGPRAGGISKALLRVLGDAWRKWARAYREEEDASLHHLHLYLYRDGLMYGWSPPGAWRSYRMRRDPQAPSRSFLKLEEAFVRMGCEPQSGDRVADLGAAPGGWTYACLKRGADVVAVDRGPLKLPRAGKGWGEVFQRLEDGLTFRPERPPVDWLVADMLVPPGAALGLLKNWMGRDWARRLVVNVKLPQQEPWPALRPVVQWVNAQTAYRSDIRQLYHDRREVTVMAVTQTD